MSFRVKRPGFGLQAELGFVKKVVARKVQIAAEAEIQSMLKEIEGRIRAAIKDNVRVEIGDLQSVIHDFDRVERIDVRIHVSDSPSTEGVGVNVSGRGAS